MCVKACFFFPALSVFLSSGLSSLFNRWDLPVAVFPFNTVIILYLLCTGPDHPYFPHHRVIPPGTPEPNGTELVAAEVSRRPDDPESHVFSEVTVKQTQITKPEM